jgi:hypothetical protein
VRTPARQATRPRSLPIAAGVARPGGLAGALAHSLALGALSGVLALTLARWGPPGTDLPAHLYAIDAWRESGLRVWDNLWYGGRYAQVSYSPLFPPLAALVGPAAAAAFSAAGASVAFAQVLRARWGSRSAPAAVAFALLAPAAVLSGQLPFLLGIALALGALWALQGGRVALALLLLLLAALASPLALAFALVPLIAVAATTPGWWRRRRLLVAAAGVCAIAALVWLQQRAFGRAGGQYPASPSEAITIALWCAAGLALAWRVAGQRLMLAVVAVYAALGAVALAVPSPLGGNWVRLVLFMGVPLLLVPMAARRFRPLALALPVLAIALAWQTAYVVGVVRESAASRSSEEAFWRPVQGFLARHADPGYRVEAVATTGRWEAYYLPRHGVAIARGWFRQDDWPQNATLYDEPLTPASYRRWLRDLGVRYVVLPDDHRDASARAEALLVHRRSVLPAVARLPGWTVYELPHATPIATPADGIRVTALDEDAVTLRVARPGTYRLRLTYTPYWRVDGPACVEPRAPWGTTLRAAAPATVVLRVDVTPGRVLDALVGRSSRCAAGPAGLR